MGKSPQNGSASNGGATKGSKMVLKMKAIYEKAACKMSRGASAAMTMAQDQQFKTTDATAIPPDMALKMKAIYEEAAKVSKAAAEIKARDQKLKATWTSNKNSKNTDAAAIRPHMELEMKTMCKEAAKISKALSAAMIKAQDQIQKNSRNTSKSKR